MLEALSVDPDLKMIYEEILSSSLHILLAHEGVQNTSDEISISLLSVGRGVQVALAFSSEPRAKRWKGYFAELKAPHVFELLKNAPIEYLLIDFNKDGSSFYRIPKLLFSVLAEGEIPEPLYPCQASLNQSVFFAKELFPSDILAQVSQSLSSRSEIAKIAYGAVSSPWENKPIPSFFVQRSQEEGSSSLLGEQVKEQIQEEVTLLQNGVFQVSIIDEDDFWQKAYLQGAVFFAK